MPLTPGSDAIVGGTVLRIPAIQSPDYVPGVSGWIVRQDGSAEFNNGTFRGSIEVGPVTGAHFIVNNPATGDVVDVYNGSNQLVFSIDGNGAVHSIDPATGLYVQISQGTVAFNSQTSPLAVAGHVEQGFLGSDPLLSLTSGEAAGGTPVEIELQSSSVGVGQAVATINQYGILGGIVQNDNASGLGSGNVIHSNTYSGTVGANGVWDFPHGCSFPPVRAILTPWDVAGVQSRNYVVLGATTFSGGNCNTQWWDGAGNRVAAGTTVGVHAVFLG